MTTRPASRHTRRDCALANAQPACDKERGHAIEPGPVPACRSSRRQRPADLESARPGQETSTDTVLLQALVTKLVLVRGSAATPTEQLPVRTLAATMFVRPLIANVLPVVRRLARSPSSGRAGRPWGYTAEIVNMQSHGSSKMARTLTPPATPALITYSDTTPPGYVT